jgi:hypothetical protein
MTYDGKDEEPVTVQDLENLTESSPSFVDVAGEKLC